MTCSLSRESTGARHPQKEAIKDKRIMKQKRSSVKINLFLIVIPKSGENYTSSWIINFK
jgi:hypothetical protein